MAPGKSNGQGAVPREGFIKEAQFKLNLHMDCSLCKRWFRSGLLMQATDTQAKVAKAEVEFFGPPN